MAAPIIQTISITPDPVPVGQQATIIIDAYDPDASVVSADVIVTDSQGNQQIGSGSFTVSDPLTFQVTVNSGSVSQDAANPNVWYWTP